MREQGKEEGKIKVWLETRARDMRPFLFSDMTGTETIRAKTESWFLGTTDLFLPLFISTRISLDFDRRILGA